MGYSLGGTLTLNWLSKNSRARLYVGQVASLAPCFVPSLVEGVDVSNLTVGALVLYLDLLGIQSAFGPNWDDEVASACPGWYPGLCVEKRSFGGLTYWKFRAML